MKCSVCGNDFPSQYYFSTPTVCNDCFRKLPQEQQESLKSQHRGFGEGANRPTASKPLYLGSIFGGILVSGALVITAEDAPYSVSRNAALDLMLIAIALAVFSVIMFLVLIYNAWSAIQDGHASTTPGKAVGGLFIPFVNILWNFWVWYGFAKDFNQYVVRHAVAVRKLPQKLFLAVPILSLAPPVLAGVAELLGLPEQAIGGLALGSIGAELVVTFTATYKMCGGINSLAATSGGRATAMA